MNNLINQAKHIIEYNRKKVNAFTDSLVRANRRLRHLRRLIIRKPDIAITDTKFECPNIDGIYIAIPNEKISFEASYQNQKPVSTSAIIQQSMDSKEDIEKLVIFTGNATYKLKLEHEITETEPFKLNCKAVAKNPVTDETLDEFEQPYNIGVLDNNPKPVSDYPVDIAGVKNDIQNSPYDWQGDRSYKLYWPDGVDVPGLSVETDGILLYQDAHYKDPRSSSHKLTLSFTMTNNTGYDLAYGYSGYYFKTYYDDLKHYSQIDNTHEEPDHHFAKGAQKQISDTITIPDWAYGYISIALITRLKGEPITWEFTVYTLDIFIGRILLP